MSCTIEEAQDVLASAEKLYSLTEIEQELAALAKQVSKDFAKLNPLVISVMNGGLVTTGYLLPHLGFPLELDYLHATRYRQEVTGGGISWVSRPHKTLKNRHILVVDDIFDEGFTLAEVSDYCHQAGALSVKILVLCDKQHQRQKADLKLDYVAFNIPDAYVFGFGMDYKGYHRNAPGIFACTPASLEKYA